VAAFQWASKEGVIAEENMRGIVFEVGAWNTGRTTVAFS
jgi:hypothetical protein